MRKMIFLTMALACIVQVQGQCLPQDKQVRKGVLKNGLTYYVRHNDQTPNVAEFYIAQRVGSILEEPRQRGLAHFLEHMAFNGTQNFPGAEKEGLRDWCEKAGIKFGANLNAYTSVDQTVYNISSAPVNKAGVLDTCLLILHDWSHYLLLEDEEIDKERGVIHEEWRTRRAGMASSRLMEEAMPVMYQGTKYEDCLPIGSMDVVDHFEYSALRDYYHKWYRPDLQAIIVVGDIDAGEVEQKIKQLFSSIPMPKNAAKRIYYPVNDNQQMIVFAKQDKEQPICLFSLYMKRDNTPTKNRNTRKYYRDGYVAGVVMSMLNDRIAELGKVADPPFLSASARDGQFFISSTKDAFLVSTSLKQDRIREGIIAAVGEAERARRFGFTQAELDRAKAEEVRVAENRYNNREKVKNSRYVGICLRNFLQNEPMLSEEDELNLVREIDKEVTLDEVNLMVKEMITDRNQVVTLYAPETDDFQMPSERDLESYVYTAQQADYEPYKEQPAKELWRDELPSVGSIAAEEEGEFGYRHLVLSNGMNVYVRQTDFDPDRISMNCFSLGGKSLYPDEDMESMNFIGRVMAVSGVADLDDTQLEKALAGKTVRVSPFVGSETEGIQGSSNTKDLETMLQLTHLYFTQPRRDNQAFESVINKQRSFLTNREANPNVSYNDSLTAILYGNHPRLQPMKKERLDLINHDRIMEIYQERFANAADFNVIFTGNVPLETLRPLLCKYLATLPATNEHEEVIDRHIDIREVDEVHSFKKPMATPSVTTNIYITSPMAYTALTDLKMSVLCQIMRMVYTEKVREEKGGTYGVSVQGQMQMFPKQEGVMTINFRTAPEKYDELIPIIYEQLKLMAENGPKEQELNKVKEYELKTYDENIVTNGYWEYVQYNRLRLGIDFDTDYKQMVESLTCKDIQDFCRELLKPNNRIQVTMLPE